MDWHTVTTARLNLPFILHPALCKGRYAPGMTTSDPSGSPVFARIAIGIDFSRSSDSALTLARTHFPGGERLLIHVVDARAASVPDLSGAGMVPITPGPDLLGTLGAVDRERLETLSQVGESRETVMGDPASALVEAAEKWGAELIVVGSHQQGAVERFFVGSVAEQVLKKSRVPVLVVKVGGER